MKTIATSLILLSATVLAAQSSPCPSERPDLDTWLATTAANNGGVYKISAARKQTILKNYAKVAIGMTRQEVAHLLGDPDYEQPLVRHAPIRTDGTRDTVGQCSYQWGYYFEKIGNSGLGEHDAQLIMSFNTEQLTWAFPQNIPGLTEKGSPAAMGTPKTAELKPEDSEGQFTTPGVYENPSLGMRMTLPGEWQFFDKETQRQMGLHPVASTKDPNCRGAFCEMDVDVALISKRGTPPVGSIFISGYRLPLELRLSKNFPLEKFAEAMMKRSLGSQIGCPSEK